MSIKIITIARFWLMFGLIINIPNGFALSLSELELHSKLNEKLDATIVFNAISSKELENLKIGVSYDESLGGIYRKPTIQIQLVKQANGKHFIQLKSYKPITEPVVSFTLELNWSNGRLNRYYELLIDPELG